MNKDYIILDIETRSHCNLESFGAWVYSKHPTTEILLCCWKYLDDDDVHTWKKGDSIPGEIRSHKGYFIAHNAKFEYALFRNAKNDFPASMHDWNRWICTMAMSRRAGLPGGLERTAHILNLDKRKLDIGKDMIQLFSIPKKVNGAFYYQRTTEADLQQFIEYCRQDVIVTEKLYNTLKGLPNNSLETNVFYLDMKQNIEGLPVDVDSLNMMIEKLNTAKAKAESMSETYGINVKSNTELPRWLKERGVILENNTADTINGYLDVCTNETIREVLNLRILLSRSSVKKFDSLFDLIDDENKLRYFLSYYGAGTGRWAGQGFQPHNLPKTNTKADEIEKILDDFKNDRIEFKDTMIQAKKVLPGLIKAPDGFTFIIGDFASIEARILAFISGQKDLTEKFRKNEDIYIDMASVIYRKPADKITKHERQLGKMAILGAGYSMSPKKFQMICEARKIGVSDSLAEEAIYSYRRKNDKIAAYWKECDYAFNSAYEYPGKCYTIGKYVKVKRVKSYIQVVLPSGRSMYYHQIEKDNKGLSYLNHIKSYKVNIYGGLITENIVQAIARDILCDRMLGLEASGLNTLFHVHDEAIVQAPEKDIEVSKAIFDEIMNEEPAWLDCLPLKTESEISKRYHK